MKKLVSSLAMACALVSAHARAEMNCDTYASSLLGKDVEYCVDRSRPDLEPTPGEPVAYFMHGTNGGARTWHRNDYEDQLSDLRQKKTLAPMTFVSFDTEAYSFFTDQANERDVNDPNYDPDTYTPNAKMYETWLVTEFIPMIEKTRGVCAKRECRGLIGESMGGFGALKTALRHPDLFSAVAVNSPAFAPFETRRPFWDWVGYYTHKPLGPVFGFFMTYIVLDVFPDEETFEANDPIRLANGFSSKYPFPALYFDMGGDDRYGFEDGYARFKAALDARKLPYSTNFEADAGHDMWERHGGEAIQFLEDHLASGNGAPPARERAKDSASKNQDQGDDAGDAQVPVSEDDE